MEMGGNGVTEDAKISVTLGICSRESIFILAAPGEDLEASNKLSIVDYVAGAHTSFTKLCHELSELGVVFSGCGR